MLLASLGVVIASGSLLHLMLLLALGAVLQGKARREEQALAERHRTTASIWRALPPSSPIARPGLAVLSREKLMLK